MATILPNAVNQFIDASGNPLAGGTVFMYIPNSSTPKDTYQDSAGTILNTNPIVLNASGEAIIYGSGAYRQVVYDANGDLIWDQITADTSVGGFAWGGVTTGTANAQVGDASSFSSQDGQQYGFIAGFSNSGPMTINPGGSGAIPVLRDSPLGPVPCVGGEVVADNECTLVYEAARGAFHLTNPAIGTMASQNANAVAITGGTIAGVTITTSTITQPTLTLKQSAAPTPTADGDAQWDTDDNFLVVGNGATQTIFRPAMPGTLWGCVISNNVADATNDIDVTAGFAADSTNVVLMHLATALTKRLDATWAVGNNQGMRDTGSISDATWHIFIIMRPDSGVVDVLASLSATAPTMPTNYTYFRRIGSIVRTGGAIKAFTQYGDLFQWTSSVLDVSTNNPGTSAVTATLTVATGVAVLAQIIASADISSSGGDGIVSALTQTDATPSPTLSNFGFDSDAPGHTPSALSIATNTSGQVRYRVSTSSAGLTVYLRTFGYVDTRGRLA